MTAFLDNMFEMLAAKCETPRVLNIVQTSRGQHRVVSAWPTLQSVFGTEPAKELGKIETTSESDNK
jgi:hypothetical protein